jgi:surface polysaccharide O-acyltransferase-like enzyme
LLWADLIRIVALFAVVLLHTAAVPATRYGEIPASWWWSANLYDSFVRPCVPLFIMVSGAMLLDPGRPQPLAYFFRRRVSRIVVPLLGWSVLYAAWRIFGRGESMTVGQFGYHLLAGMADPVAIHLWFMYLIVSLYLVTPIFRIYVGHASHQSQLYFAALWLFATGIRPLLHDHLGLTIGLSFEPVTGFIGYFVLGWTLRSMLSEASRPRLALGAAAGFALGYVVTVFGTEWLSAEKGSLDEYFYSYVSLNVMLMSICGYLFLRECGVAWARRSGARLSRSIEAVSALGLGAYLVHALLLEMLARGSFGFVLDGVAFHPAAAIPLTALLAFGASLLICRLLRAVPGVRALVP